MTKKNMLQATTAVLMLLFILGCGLPAFADQNSDAALKKEIEQLKGRINLLEEKVGEGQQERSLLPGLPGMDVAGGISGGAFYATNPGAGESDNDFLLSNFLVELSSRDNNLPISFCAAFGETSTPSLLDPPENNSDFDIEYASVTLQMTGSLSLETGLLQPNTGYEDTYTYNNANIVCSVTGSRQPYNAYGARLAWDAAESISLYAGYYSTRLDDEEYRVDLGGGVFLDAGDSWEAGLTASIGGFDVSVYNYHLNRLRNLAGLVVERTVGDIYMAVNVDYWRWDNTMKFYYKNGRHSATACALYVDPRFGKFSVPLRLEYINQGSSMIYSDNSNTDRIYTATITPTYNFSDNTYVRVEASYVSADFAFADQDGYVKDKRSYLAAEMGYRF